MYYIKEYDSIIGKIVLASDGEYLTHLAFNSSNDFSLLVDAGVKGELTIFEETINWLDSYFNGEEMNSIPNIKIDNLSLFQQEVLQQLLKIPYGSTTNYGEIARIIALKRRIKRMSAQAVGTAIANNPIGIIIPCHRVIKADGSIGGFAGGVDCKRKLLQIEGHQEFK